MKSMRLLSDLFWVGVLDPELRVFDIVLKTAFGTTYNAYLLKGSEKTALFETVKPKFMDEFFRDLAQTVDVSTIDYLIVNHTEPDHAGSIARLLELNPAITIVGTAPAITFLKFIVHREFRSRIVKDNDTLSLGDKTLRFMPLPNLHWPDTMFTYLEEERVLFTCDVFGCHYSHSGIVRSTLTDEKGYQEALKYYFDMIMGPFKRPFVQNALKRIAGLPVAMIATGHGPVLDSRIDEVIGKYAEWSGNSSPFTKKTVIIPFVSAYGYTKELAELIASGIRESGDFDVRIHDMVETPSASVLEEIGWADGVLFGTPTMVGEALKPLWDLATSLYPPVHGKKWAGAFGSYGWSGEGVLHLTERLKQVNMKVVDGFRVRFKPTEEDKKNAVVFGRDFGQRILSF
ncbi:MAG TPA: FprA family A-type flavoprotein [Candidatus Izemoplasmatales bacterium]|nr:FprA family A-type flavoprotein [Candidatus Izemoplasmatales bacterium]